MKFTNSLIVACCVSLLAVSTAVSAQEGSVKGEGTIATPAAAVGASQTSAAPGSTVQGATAQNSTVPSAPAPSTAAPAVTPPPAQAEVPANVMVELNKLEPQAKSCRIYMLVDNKSEQAFQTLKLDLILFRPDGVIERRLALDLAPLRAHKTSVKTFDLDQVECSGISSVLVNDAIECRAETSAVPDCLDRLKLSSRAPAKFSK